MLVTLLVASTDVEIARMQKERTVNSNEDLNKVMYRLGVRYLQLKDYKEKWVRKAASLS